MREAKNIRSAEKGREKGEDLGFSSKCVQQKKKKEMVRGGWKGGRIEGIVEIVWEDEWKRERELYMNPGFDLRGINPGMNPRKNRGFEIFIQPI